MENLSHQSNNAKKKGKNQKNNNLRLGGNNPLQNQPIGGNQNQGNQNPQGDNNNKCQGRKKNNNLRTNFPCAPCGENGHYTHHFAQISDFQWMKESMNTSCPPVSPAPRQVPQQYFQQPPSIILKNPIPHQGVMDTQREVHPSPQSMGQYPNPGPIHPSNQVDCNILLTSEE
jgi:hypothetical protein